MNKTKDSNAEVMQEEELRAWEGIIISMLEELDLRKMRLVYHFICGMIRKS